MNIIEFINQIKTNLKENEIYTGEPIDGYTALPSYSFIVPTENVLNSLNEIKEFIINEGINLSKQDLEPEAESNSYFVSFNYTVRNSKSTIIAEGKGNNVVTLHDSKKITSQSCVDSISEYLENKVEKNYDFKGNVIPIKVTVIIMSITKLPV